MLEGIKKVFKDIFETLRKEAGELKISTEPISTDSQIYSEKPVDVVVKEPDAEEIHKEVEIINSFEADGEIILHEVKSPVNILKILEETLEMNAGIFPFSLPESESIDVKNFEELSEINHITIKSRLEELQPIFYSPPTELFSKIYSFFSVFSIISVRRKPAPRKDYTDEEIKKALKFIIERIPEGTKLKFSGVFRDVPINRIKQISFDFGDMLFTVNSANMNEDPGIAHSNRMIILDVLIMKDEKAGKYYVGPVVRKI